MPTGRKTPTQTQTQTAIGVKRVHVKVQMWKAQSFKYSQIISNVPVVYSIYHQRAGKTNLFHMRGGTILVYPAQWLSYRRLLTRNSPTNLNVPIFKCINQVIGFDKRPQGALMRTPPCGGAERHQSVTRTESAQETPT